MLLVAVDPTDAEEAAANAKRGGLRHQAILSIDMPTWRAVIENFKITTPMIPHRKEMVQAGPGARGWYT